MTDYKRYSRPATDVYSRKHIDKQFDRFERLYDLQKKRIKDLEQSLAEIKLRLSFTVPEFKQ